jgi:staphylococcal nuclease domain-containing protein 1
VRRPHTFCSPTLTPATGIRAPRTSRNAAEKSEPFGQEAADFATRRYMQRDVEVELDATDKAGGFVGALFLNKNENAAVALVREGLASVHAHSAEGLAWARQLADAEVRERVRHARRVLTRDRPRRRRRNAECVSCRSSPRRR